MIKNIVFDLGGVVLSEDDNWLLSRQTKSLLEASDEQLNKGWNLAWPDFRDGKIDENTFFNMFLQNSINRFDQGLVSKLKDIYRKQSLKLDVIYLLPKLKTVYKTFALTNAGKEWLLFKAKKFNLEDCFNLIISSCDEHVAKPNKEIFLSLIEKGKMDPKESVFVDNMEKNIKPAQELGFKTILFENKKQMIKEMRKLGIKI